MLPSTGYFKAINCPFYENGYCERPYCHFRHSRRDGASSSAVVTSESSQTVPKPQNAGSASVSATNPDVIQQLVSEAVKKVLADQNVSDTENIVNKVVEGLKPKLVPALTSTTPVISQEIIPKEPVVGKHLGVPVLPSAKPSPCVYNPTPIAELKKRHIPITAYEPTRESKAVKRKSPDVDRPWMAVIRNISSSKESKVSYTPTAISQTISTDKNSIHKYIPTMKSESSMNLYDINSSNDSYIPEKKKKKKKDMYLPKPKKRREEYVPRKPKVPLKDKQHLEDDVYDVLDELLCRSETNPNVVVDEESQDLMEVEPKYSNNAGGTAVVSTTKEQKVEAIVNKTLNDEKENKELKESNETDNDSDDNSSVRSNKEKSYRSEESSKHSREDVSKSKYKSSEKSNKEDKHNKHKEDAKSSKIKEDDSKHSKSKEDDSKHSKSKEDDSKHSKSKEDDSKHSKSKEEDSKHSKSKEEDTRHTKSKEEDSRHSKSKDKDRGDEKKDKEKDRDKNKEKDKYKHSSKSNDKERSSSSSKDSRSKDKDKDKDKDKNKVKDSRSSKDSSKDNSHRNKKDSKSDKEKSSSSRDSKDKKESKDKSKHKSDDKNKHKSKSSSSDSKSKSSKSHKSSDRHGSHSSHKSSKSNEKPAETEGSDKNEEKSDRDEKCDSPEYEEFSPFYDEQLLETSDSDHDVEEECRKIFQEYEVSDHPRDVTSKAPPKPEAEEPEDTFKKRVAHPSAVSNMTKQVGPTQPVKRLTNPQQRMYERWRMMREVAAEKAAEKAAASKALEIALQKKALENSCSAHHNDHQVNGNGRIRIAQVPYAMSLALEKKKVLEQAAKIETKTVAQNKKGGSRVAHIPQMVPQLIRPEPLQTSGTQKFPLNVRQFYINAMQDICVQIYTSADDAAQRAVREEFACYEKCKALNVYKNSCMLTVHRLRKEVDQKSDESSASCSGTISHEAVLAGKVKGSWSVMKPRKLTTDFKGVSLYHMLTKWIMTEQDLKDNGFPRPHPDGPKGRAKLYVSNTRGQSTLSKVPNERICCRCNKSYMVDKHGFPMRKENCIYHYARKFTFRGESKYMCCKQDGSSDGCCDATTHVWDFVDVENLRGYVSTFDKDTSADEQGIFALDCEMCYTTQGLELTRVTVINDELQVVYETLVKPSHAIIDYNTRFSGICEADMKKVTTTLLDVQATLLSMFSSKTILIGHSLESDFKALKLLHDTVVDTSVMFPHKNGPPYKRALKNLCSEYLQKIIQNEIGGHDSKEDAAACMELVLWKVKEEAKLQ